MNVKELRELVKSKTEPVKIINGRGVYHMPDGSLVSKAKKEDLLTYLTSLETTSAPAPAPAPAPAQESKGLNETSESEEMKLTQNLVEVESIRKMRYNRYQKKIRKYSKRRQTPGNVKSLSRWADKLKRLERELEQC